jgi:biopolymer transport protein ExbB
MTNLLGNPPMHGFRTRFLLLLLTAVASLWTSQAYAWWNDDWAFRKEIKFDLSKTGADIPDSATDVPVLIRLSLGNFGYFADTAPDGADLRFIGPDDKTPLKYHIERYDPQAQMAFLWVRVPRLTGGANTDKIYLYYGSKKAKQGADPGGTYDTNQVLVYHFGAAAGSPQDSTSYKTEPSAFKATVNPASLIGAGAQFKGAEVITIPATPGLRLVPTQGITISAWVRIEGAQQNAAVAALQDGGKELVLGINGTQAFVRLNGATAPVSVTQSGGALNAGEWHHLAVRAGSGKVTLLVDGVEAGSAAATLPEIGGTLTIGGSAQGGSFLTGEVDELQVSNTARSNDWVLAAARSQGMVAPLIVYGGDAQKDSGGGESYFATTLRSVTVDGWVVIGILGVLFFASVGIMASKLVYLNRVGKGNAKFLAEFRKMGDDPLTALTSSQDAFGISTLWRLYHHGMRETMKRIEGQPAGADRVRTLSAQSIEAIRATLDASLTRMTQRLNSQMVWLTICISGGPFLGLLGTVLGVMITFAAIAASGDVNINAIAPGTAAALVATVVGLGVAIPCLFGYNYLNTRIKEIVADMRVFVDEFVTRIAETYS